MIEKPFLAIGHWRSGFDELLDHPYVLINAYHFWASKKFNYNIHLHKNVREVFLDSGGYSFISKQKKYEFTPLQYTDFIKQLKPTFAAVMDYPCDISVPFTTFKNNYERIEATIDNAIKLKEINDEINWVMVIQGWTSEEYLYCIDRIREQNLFTKLTAIGCIKRSKISESSDIATLIRKNIPSWVKLHGFGIDYRHLKNYIIFKSLDSMDTGAWRFNPPEFNKEYRFPKTDEELLRNFNHYKTKINNLIDYQKDQSILETFLEVKK